MKIWKCINIFLSDASRNLQSKTLAKFTLRRQLYFWRSTTQLFSLEITYTQQTFIVYYVPDTKDLNQRAHSHLLQVAHNVMAFHNRICCKLFSSLGPSFQALVFANPLYANIFNSTIKIVFNLSSVVCCLFGQVILEMNDHTLCFK